MSINILSDTQKNVYHNRIAAIKSHFDNMITEINKGLYEYGKVHNGLVRETIHPNFARDQKQTLSENIKNIHLASIENSVYVLLKIKEDYLEAVFPSSTTSLDSLEIALLEKELSVMTDAELQTFYLDNARDRTISRLCVIEHKKRNNYKAGGAYIPLSLNAYLDQYSDDLIKEINKSINLSRGMREISSRMCVFPVFDEEGHATPKMISWDVLLRQVELRNQGDAAIQLTLMDFISPNFIK